MFTRSAECGLLKTAHIRQVQFGSDDPRLAEKRVDLSVSIEFTGSTWKPPVLTGPYEEPTQMGNVLPYLRNMYFSFSMIGILRHSFFF